MSHGVEIISKGQHLMSSSHHVTIEVDTRTNFGRAILALATSEPLIMAAHLVVADSSHNATEPTLSLIRQDLLDQLQRDATQERVAILACTPMTARPDGFGTTRHTVSALAVRMPTHVLRADG